MKKPFYKKIWFWVIAILLIGIINGGINKTNNIKAEENNKIAEINETNEANEETLKEVEAGITKDYLESKTDIEIINIQNEGDNYYTIDFKVKEVVSDKYYKPSILNSIKEISKILNDVNLLAENEFFFEAKGPGKDKYGNEVEMNYATSFVKGNELVKCNFKDISLEDFENVLQSFAVNSSFK